MTRRLELGEFCGRSVRRRRVHGFLLTENRFRPGLEIASHAHRHPHFTFVVSGGFTERYAQREFRCAPGSLLLVPADEAHTDSVWTEGAHSLGVELSPGTMRRLGEGSDLLRRPDVLSHEPIRRASQRLLSEFVSTDIAAELCLESLALEVLVLSARHAHVSERGVPKWMARVVERLHDGSSAVSLENLAAEAGVHPTHLARAFKKVHGCTVGEYLRRTRIEAGASELRRTRKPVAQIAAEVGFCDPSHFCREFRRAYGISPSAFRAEGR